MLVDWRFIGTGFLEFGGEGGGGIEGPWRWEE